MTRQFHDQLATLKTRVVKMGDLARQSLLEGVKSLADLDLELAKRVIQLDQDINRMDVEIERDALDLLARNQPMAVDLRTLGATLKIITYLDRIGRYGYDVANATNKMEGKEHVRKLVAIPHMAELASKMLGDALTAYANNDERLVRSVFPQDELVDALYEQVFRECLTYMLEDARTITTCAHYILVARHLERAADNAGKIAEKTLYMITGERRIKV